MIQSRFMILWCLVLVLLTSQFSMAQQSSIPGANYLGKSVNLLKGETAPGSKSLINDLSDDEIDNLGSGSGSYDSRTAIAEDVREAEDKYSVEMGMEGSYGAFSAKAEMKFSKEVRERSKTTIVTITKDLLSAKLSIKSRTLSLTNEFAYALNDPNTSPKVLFQNYGTHITLGVGVGGRVTGIFSSQENSSTANQELKVAASASYAGVTGNVSSNQSRSNSSQSVRINETWIFKGGKSVHLAALDQGKNSQNYRNWASSVDDFPGFFAFEELKPIWELATDPNRRSALEQAFKVMFTVMSLENPERFKYTSEAKAKISTETLTVPRGYKILSGGAKVNWLGAQKGNLLTASYPQNLKNWVASHKDHHVSDASTITIYAMAIFDPFDMLDVKIEEQSSAQNMKVIETNSSGYAPNSGYALVGGGAKAVYDGAGSLLTGSYPNISNEGKWFWTANSMDHMVSDPSYLVSYAIFVRFKQNVPYSIQTQFFPAESRVGGVIKVNAGVGFGYRLVGGGAVTKATNGTVTQNFLTASYPDGDRWYAESKDHHMSKLAILKAIAIGIKVVEK